jgi:pyruvate/2-oxoglutarate dehydrogenase complex dihydrolipoamide dehydrogenase (E3) component
MTQQYDLIVIGTGTGASVAADRCRAAGWRVAVIDHLPFGGTCALCGCDPKKVLVGAAEAIDQVCRMRGHGLAGGEPAIASDELIRFKRSFTEPVPAIKEKSFERNGIDTYHGRAKFCPDLIISYTRIGVTHLGSKSDEHKTKSLCRELQAASRADDPGARPGHWRGLPGHEAG